jgi:hypothetical protein
VREQEGTTGGPCSGIFIQAYCPPDSQYCLYTGYNSTLRKFLGLLADGLISIRTWDVFSSIDP